MSRCTLHRLLDLRPLVFIGKISYGIYVWHFPILWFLERSASPRLWLFWPATIAATLLSYYLLERPCLRLKAKFSGVDGLHRRHRGQT
ncbi:MAG TPA: acyltransferase family protein [Verrucomicrobiae bacterium]|nr:acyltransferase family protein [Verrucomicrobiae bacterium]